ncbi:MAG: metallophosphoesterase [Treponema sp.]|nr:metallophosphoesterase [Treponema sp.]
MKSEISVVLFSDIHLGHQRGKAYLQKIVDKANALNPDLVFIAGDLVDTEPAFKPGVLDVLSGFKVPVYFTEGNHDEYLGSERLQKLLKQHGVRILRNEVVQTHGIQLIGLNYMNADENAFDMHPSDDQDTVKSVLAKMPLESDIPSILLQHSPVGVQYAEAAGIDLMLAGHTHGGQIFPFTLIARLSFPLSGGLYRQGKTQTFVSKGAGTFMMRARLGTFNEINLLRLIPEN